MTPDEILRLRLRLGLTQTELAERVGLLTKGAISLWESGKRAPTATALIVLRSLADGAKRRKKKGNRG